MQLSKWPVAPEIQPWTATGRSRDKMDWFPVTEYLSLMGLTNGIILSASPDVEW